MKNRLLVLSRYSRKGASSRLRAMQYEKYLQDAGLEVEYAELFDDDYLQSLYSGKNARTSLIKYYQKRISKLIRSPKPDLIWLEYEALPWLPWVIERALLPPSTPIVSDYDDAVFHRYDLHRFSPVRSILGRKIDHVMRRSQLVIAGNDYLVARAQDSGATQVEKVPTVVDLSNYTLPADSRKASRLIVGWIGTPNTWEAFGRRMYTKLEDLLTINGARFLAVGAQLDPKSIGNLDIVPWSEGTEVEAIKGMDIGIMPLTDTPWSRGKCGYKLIQYMACGIPVVASPVGVNSEIVEHGVNGFLAKDEEEWCSAIEKLLSDDALRCRMGAAGRKKVEEAYSIQVWGPRVAGMLRDVADQSSRA